MVLKSDPKFFGNSASRDEKFFDFRDLRIYKKKLSKEEILKLSDPKNIWTHKFPYLDDVYNDLIDQIVEVLPWDGLLSSVERSTRLNTIGV